MRKYKILITGEKVNLKNYVQAVQSVGLCPVFFGEENFDALILSGGGDVSPCLYNQPNIYSNSIDISRDCKELYLIKKCLAENKCILGICRGMQILNVFFGGSLTQNVACLNRHSRQNKKHDKTHLVSALPNSFLHKLFGSVFCVNSAHHQAVGVLGKNLLPSAFACDGEIEAFSYKKVLAVQFHPERMTTPQTADGQLIFKCFKRLVVGL